MQDSWDIAVLGGGPAGGEAARAAAAYGARIVLIDEQARPGGQVWRAKDTAREDVGDSSETAAGNLHRARLEKSTVTFLSQARLWHIERAEDQWHLHLLVDGCSQRHAARSVILAPGAREFVQPFPGWTTPGVFGLAGVTALMKSQQCPPGRRSVVSGGGPLAIFAASEILRLGGEVAAVVTPNSKAEWLRCWPEFMANPSLTLRGAEMMMRLKRAGVPILWRHLVSRASGDPTLRAVQVTPCHANWTPRGGESAIEADALCVGHGLVPNSEVAVLAGLTPQYDAQQGGWIAASGPLGETELPGLYLCGDGAGLRGAAASQNQGARVGEAAAMALNGQRPGKTSHRTSAAERFGRAMTRLAIPQPGLARLTDADTIVCRCEAIPRRKLDAAIDAGATSLDALKSATRCGMGPCGGKYCLTNAARLIGEKTGKQLADIPPPVPRPPLFPLPVDAVGAGFDYDNLPIPAPAPL
ncbi:NAD(P)/FAD-dependent oxidoreductase [Mesorhizobium sp. Z1-4]|uniref:NAD(P)/FAD-dependent oxidoreductase n=1 Tax=Mesorhizobium sp. Z1-4 TaxID=2448478 RepID=UPI000FD9C4F5|nr:NAD(P)/FAD-dependent oxidoreductase [Mesorhizobium sp. Z1-4]